MIRPTVVWTCDKCGKGLAMVGPAPMQPEGWAVLCPECAKELKNEEGEEKLD